VRITRSWAGCPDCILLSGLSPDGEVFLLTSPFIDRYLGEVPGAIEKPNSFDIKLCRISAALRQGSNSDSHFVGFLVVQNEHHRRDASLFSIAVRFPKLDVAGSIPVSRFSF